MVELRPLLRAVFGISGHQLVGALAGQHHFYCLDAAFDSIRIGMSDASLTGAPRPYRLGPFGNEVFGSTYSSW